MCCRLALLIEVAKLGSVGLTQSTCAWHVAQIGPFSDADSLPQWAIALIVMGSCITLAIVMVLIAKAMHYYNLIMSPGALQSTEIPLWMSYWGLGQWPNCVSSSQAIGTLSARASTGNWQLSVP